MINQARRMISRNDSSTRIATLQDRPNQPRVEATLQFGFLTVAMPAVGLQDRPNVPFERRFRGAAIAKRQTPKSHGNDGNRTRNDNALSSHGVSSINLSGWTRRGLREAKRSMPKQKAIRPAILRDYFPVLILALGGSCRSDLESVRKINQAERGISLRSLRMNLRLWPVYDRAKDGIVHTIPAP